MPGGWPRRVTVGQAFGGDHEAVTTHTGLLAARHVVGADVAVVAQGPGNVGTGTRWGYSGVACADALHAADVLGGRGVASLRVSGADRRERHRGISHHSRTAYGRALLTPADVPVTTLPDPELDALVRAQLAELVGTARATLTVVEVPADGLLDALRTSPVALTTMGRGLDEDPAPFVAAAAAGAHAVRACSAHVHEVDDEDQRLAGLDRATGAAVAVAEVRRDGEPAAAADLHALDALVPAGDDHADAEAEVQRRAAVPRGVELLAGRVRDADVVRARRCCRPWPRGRHRR